MDSALLFLLTHSDTADAHGIDNTPAVEIWRGAETIEEYFGKGSPIVVWGELQERTWTDKDGNVLCPPMTTDEASRKGIQL